jgi:hypothetical protein
MYDIDQLMIKYGGFTLADLNGMPLLDYTVHHTKINERLKKEFEEE